MSLGKVFQDLRAAIKKYNNSSTESSKVNTPSLMRLKCYMLWSCRYPG